MAKESTKKNKSVQNTEKDEDDKIQNEGRGGLMSPEGILMLAIACILDGIGFVIFIVGTWVAVDDYGILDITGMIIIGGWMFTRSGINSEAIKKGIKRFVTSSAIEFIPFLGGASPSWVWLVYKTLKNG